jgi:hypothetical protein
MAQAKAAAGDRNMVLLGRGRRLFDVLPSRIELEIVHVVDTPEATHIRYRVRRESSG